MTHSLANENPEDIQFDELKIGEPSIALTPPDANKSVAITAVGSESNGLKIFVDLDSILDMIDHARSNISVELGGVLLGNYWNEKEAGDADGTKRIWIRDCIRAEHYESTRGSFKFTHETWQAITEQRQRRDAQLRVVGWYHTHPNWSVFLSGMDLFICESYFKNWFDIAIVVDPVQEDIGLFYWRSGTAEPVRAEGYFLTSDHLSQHQL